MNQRQVDYFRRELMCWKGRLLEESHETIDELMKNRQSMADESDRAAEDTRRTILLRTRDRQRKLVQKIDQALSRLDSGEFGYCQVTGEQISLKRLIARPIANLSLEAQRMHERDERVFKFD